MRILQLVSSAGFYGAEQMVKHLSGALGDLGMEVCVGIFNAGSANCSKFVQEATESNIRVWDLPCSGRWNSAALWTLVRFLKSNHIDILHTHGYKANAYGLIAARLAGCSIVATCHNWTKRTPALRRYAALDRLLLRQFDMVTAVSHSIAYRLGRAGVQRMKFVPNGIDIERYRPTRDIPPRNYFVLGCVSRLSIEKGVDVLIWALPDILARFPDLHCIVVGDGPERERLRALAETLGVSGALHMPGFCDDVAEFLRHCTVFVQPSRMEAMPLAVLEAMAAGKAIVASNVGELPQLLEEGRVGMLVPPGRPELLANSILRLLADSEIRYTLGKRASEKAASQFNTSVMVQGYLRVYRAAMGRSLTGRISRSSRRRA